MTAEVTTQSKLTRVQRIRIWTRIAEEYEEDFDRHPGTVIKEDFAGDEDAYLLKMAEYFVILTN